MSGIVNKKPGGFLRAILRAPVWLYRLGLGWILGNRFLMLRYVGFKSGRRRETVIEVIRHDTAHDTYYITSAWGTGSDWFRSLCNNPKVEIFVGRRHIDAHARLLDLADAANELSRYATDHPAAFREISTLLTGRAVKGTDEDCMQLARSVPVIAIQATDSQ